MRWRAVTYLNDTEVTMKTTRKLMLTAAVLGTVAVAGCASDPYYDNYTYYDRYTYTQPQPGYTYYGPRYYSYAPGYYYGPRYYSYSYRDPYWRANPSSG
jgi:hypothetical protein